MRISAHHTRVLNRMVTSIATALFFFPGLLQADIVTQITHGATWKYLDDGSDQGTTWRDISFDDSSWSNGVAQLGYGDGDEATALSFGPDTNNKYPTTYFRKPFLVANPLDYVGGWLDVQRDDGVVIYLNGTELFRDTMPAGSPTYLTYASGTIGGGDEVTFLSSFFTNALLAGTNVIAVEIHQGNATSSDISFDLGFFSYDSLPYSIARGPYLQNATPTNIVVQWRTQFAGDSLVRYGLEPNNLIYTVSNASSNTDHSMTLTGLSADTKYYYEIGDSNGSSYRDNRFHFKTSPYPGQRDKSRIWVIGDAGTANSNARAVRDAMISYTGADRPDAWLMLGDNAYNDGTDAQFQAAVFDMYTNSLPNTPLWSTLGNHETYNGQTFSSSQTGPYYDIFTFPTSGEAGGLASGTESYYAFDYGNIHFICLNSMDVSRATNGAMLSWLQNDLFTTDQEWSIAFWHHPPYTKGSHNSDTEGNLIDMRQNALPILEASGVDLILCGHSHSYERSYYINGHYGLSGTFNTNTMVIDGGDGDPAGDGAYQRSSTTGAVYAVAGSSGKISGGTLNHPAMAVNLNLLGSLIIDVSSNRLDAAFVDDTAAARDNFTIVHSGEGNPDTDSDGLPDWWEMHFFGNLASTGTNDVDNDGMINLMESTAGSNPTDPSDVFYVDSRITNTGSNLHILTWMAAPGRTYAIESRDSFSTNSQWNLHTDFTHQPTAFYTPTYYTNSSALPTQFYRIHVTQD